MGNIELIGRKGSAMERMTNTGLVTPDRVPWGTHLCQFYETKADLLEVLVPYFKQGLAANECCVWITFDPLTVEEATNALRLAVPDLNRYLSSGQMEIVPHDTWYLIEGQFNIEAVLQAWCRKVEISLARGYCGVRASGSAAALQDDHWAELVSYEEQIQSSIHAQRLIAVCSYPLGKCSASQFLQAVNSHDCALVRRQGGWECIDNKIGNQLIDRLVEKEHALASSISPMVITDLAGHITHSNPAALTAWGYDNESEVLQRPVTEFISDPQEVQGFIERVRAHGSCVGELVATRRDGSTFDVEILGSVSFDYQGQPVGMVASCLDMTARKEAESRRKETEDCYRTLVENIGLGITLLDRDHRILAVNSVHADMIGRPADQCVGQQCFRVFEKREHVCPHCPGTRAMETGEAHEVETVGIRDDGTTYAARVQAFPVHDADSGVTGFIEVVEDITAHKQLQETLQLSQHCVEQAGDGIFWIDPSGRIILANQKACEVLEYSSEEMCSLTVFDFDLSVTPDIWQPRWETIREQRTFRVESRHRTKTGRTFPVEVSVTHLDHDGKEYHCAFARDISDRKRVEEQLAHYSAIVTSNQDAIIGVLLDGTITSWNPGAERLYGYTADEMIGHSVMRLAPPERSHETISILSNLSHDGGGTPFDTVRCRKDGTRVDISLSISPIKDSHGQIVGASTTAQDIHDRKRAEQELIVAKVAAEAANEAKSEFLANMSHEIRTPMAAILGFADILLAAASNEDTREYCQIIKRNGDQLLHVIDDILDLSKIEAGRLDLDLQICSLRHIVLDVISTMQVRADAKGLHLSVEYHGQVSDQIQTSPTRLRQVLINLIGNAIKFTELGGVRVVVSHDTAGGTSPCVRFDVIDSGIGIDEKHLDELFHPFSQVDASSCRRFGGTGLGLTISRRLARMLGGDITVSSMLGEGSTFTATVSTGLAEAKTVSQDSGGIADGNDGDTDTVPQLHCRILLAEDGPDNQRLISFLLRKAGADVVIVEDGQQAVACVQAHVGGDAPFDVILMDMQMPVMDGYEATRTLRRHGYQGPIIALTAHAMTEDRQKCLDAGCNDYLAKPMKRADLLGIVVTHAVPSGSKGSIGSRCSMT